ncbi:ImmA/IrrE family metallo-endopeptidase [Aeromonas caviae]
MIEHIKKLDDLFVFPGDSKPLKEHIRSLEEANRTLKSIPAYLRNETTRLRLYKENLNEQRHAALYRKRDDASDTLVTYWLSKVRTISSLYGVINNIPKFKGISEDDIIRILYLSNDTNNLSLIEPTLNEFGIIFIIEKSCPGLKTDGTVFINENGHAVIALSLRYKRLDNFWFTLIHELAHLNLHAEQLVEPIIEDLDASCTSLIERQANKLASEIIIPRNIWRNCPCQYDHSEEVLMAFAREMGIHPAIIAGRLRKSLENYRLYNKIINDFDVREYFKS